MQFIFSIGRKYSEKSENIIDLDSYYILYTFFCFLDHICHWNDCFFETQNYGSHSLVFIASSFRVIEDN